MTINAAENLVLNFDLNNGCNLHCMMCGGRTKPSAQLIMPLNLFQEKVLPLFHNISAFQFGCQCEPLLLPYFDEAVRLIGKTAPIAAKGALVTNGTLLTESTARLLIETPVFKRLRFSWDASYRELFNSIRCGADFDKLLDIVKELIRLRNTAQSSCSIEFNVTVLKENIRDLPEIIRLAGSLGINRVTTNKLFPDDQLYVAEAYATLLNEQLRLAEDVAADSGVAFEHQEYRLKDEYLRLISSDKVSGRCGMRQAETLDLVMEPSGDLHTPCRKVSMPIANLLHDDLSAMIDLGLMEVLKPTFASIDTHCLGCYLLETPSVETVPIHFFTIVLNGEPFIRHHIEAFKQLPFEWHWHIVEGVANLVHDTAWSLPNGGRITDELHKDGLSNDGTSDYLDKLARQYPDRITIYRKPEGRFWNGKREMVSAPLANLSGGCLLWQVDSDELWSPEAITALRNLFIGHPEKTAAYCYCEYFVGPRKYVSSLNSWATYPTDWLRVWRFKPGMCWASHEPPALVNQTGADMASVAPFSRDETVLAGVTFQHFAYALESQVHFKEIYYGYHDAVALWQRLQQTSGPVRAADYLHWALPDAMVDDWPANAAPHLAERFLAAPAAERYVSMSVHGATRFEHELRQLFRAIRPQSVIETGTFLGRGTTSIIWRACRDLALNSDITTIEVNPEHHRQACEYFTTNNMAIRLELGLSIPHSKLPDLATINETFVIKADTRDGSIYYDHNETQRAALYYGETAFDVPDNLLEATLKRCNYRPDFVLLDSAGHIGLAEFRHLLTLLRGDCHLMLDDINHCKHAATMLEIHRDPRFQILVESDEKFGFAIMRYTYVKRIIYLRTDAIGDNILSAGMLPHLKERYPGSLLTVVCQDRVAALYDACPFVDSVITFNIEKFYTQPAYRELIVHKISLLQADMVLNPIFSHDRADDYLFHECHAKIMLSLEGDNCNLEGESLELPPYSGKIPNSPDALSELEHHRTFLKGLGIDAETLVPQVWTSSTDERWAEEVLQHQGIAHGQAIVLFPGALLECKSYPHYAKVVKELHAYPLLLLGGEELRLRGDEFCNAHGGQALNLAGQTSLGQMAALMRRARIYLGSDSAGMHIACAVGLKNVVLLGGGHFGRFCPYSPLTTAICLPLSCYHCNWQCPQKRVHCLHDILPETILKALSYRLSEESECKEPTVFLQNALIAPDSPSFMPDVLKGRFKLVGESDCIANR
jgi:ADP-heptose:LPS heptosyltransferase/sulfatase maturation enzyme AslB (radical SAM superfamily)